LRIELCDRDLMHARTLTVSGRAERLAHGDIAGPGSAVLQIAVNSPADSAGSGNRLDMRAAGDRTRRSEPVVHSDDQTWDVLGHAEVVEAASDVDRFSSAVSAHLQVPNGLEGEHHTEFRALIDRYFTQERVAAAEPVIRGVARDLVAELIGRDATDSPSVRLDAVTDVGAVFAVRVQTRWLGWPESLERKWGGPETPPAEQSITSTPLAFRMVASRALCAGPQPALSSTDSRTNSGL